MSAMGQLSRKAAPGQNRAFEVIPGNYHVMQCADVRVVRCNRQLLTRNA